LLIAAQGSASSLGYVGLPVAALFARKGLSSSALILKQNGGQDQPGISPIEGKEPGLAELIAEVAASGRLKAGTDYGLLNDRDVVLIDVETPVNEAHIPEYHALREALKSLTGVMKPGVLVIIESTIMPGTMQKIVLPLLEEHSGRKWAKDIFGQLPERVMPGRLINNLKNEPRGWRRFTHNCRCDERTLLAGGGSRSR
jgi:UDP-N-acetyl-D-mannosaminuronic acid dehydrogenase